ncbi:MAG: ROK family protein [Pseudomonadota bacterium]
MGLGVDLGGTKIEAVYLDAQGREHGRQRVATPRHDYDGTVRAVADLVRAVEKTAGLSDFPVGVGIPGSISPHTGFVRNANSVWLIGRPFDRDLAEALARPVRVENDANCFALSEAFDGAAAGAASVFGVILGTGVGGGVVIDGRIVTGANGIAGEWGHIPLAAATPEELNGPLCYCGRRGCLEVWLAGPALAADFARATGAGDAGPTAHDVVEMAGDGDADAQAALERHMQRLARSLGVVVNILDPEVIVLGGGLSNMPHLYTELEAAVMPHVFADKARIDIRKARHGDSSGVRGAARLMEDGP